VFLSQAGHVTRDVILGMARGKTRRPGAKSSENDADFPKLLGTCALILQYSFKFVNMDLNCIYVIVVRRVNQQPIVDR